MRHWYHGILSHKLLNGQFYQLYENLRNQREKLFSYFRMSTKNFDKFLVLEGLQNTYRNTEQRLSVPSSERLAVAFQYITVFQTAHSLRRTYKIHCTEYVQKTARSINRKNVLLNQAIGYHYFCFHLALLQIGQTLKCDDNDVEDFVVSFED